MTSTNKQQGGELPQDELPPLPACHATMRSKDERPYAIAGYTADQMAEYARAYLAQRAASVPAQGVQQPAAEPEGWKLVPREMTDEHLREVMYNINRKYKGNPLGDEFTRLVWQWALYTAPVPAAAPVQGDARERFEKHIRGRNQYASLDRHPHLPHLYALSWVNEAWIAWMEVASVQPNSGRDAALVEPWHTGLSKERAYLDGRTSREEAMLREIAAHRLAAHPANGAKAGESVLLDLLVESQSSIGGDWRERRDAAVAAAQKGGA